MTSDPEKPGGEKSQSGLISRWSARKHAVAQSEAETAQAQIEAARLKEEQPEIEARQAENRQIAEAIDIDVADYKTDFTPFFKDGVPAALRRRALRAMWRTNPILANVDGLNDYDEDYRAVEGAFEVVKSTWEVGRGYAGKAKAVTKEMQARDEEINKAMAAQREASDMSADDDRSKSDDADTAQEANGEEQTPDGDSPAAGTADVTAEDVAVENLPPQAEPVSTRASLRQRLLQNQDRSKT